MNMGQVFGETCLISQIKLFFAPLGMSALLTLATINCACRQVRIIASMDKHQWEITFFFSSEELDNPKVWDLSSHAHTQYLLNCGGTYPNTYQTNEF
jgi:hypothetical protein